MQRLIALDAPLLQLYRAWLVLYQEEDVWQNPDKRLQMLYARLIYQNASLHRAFALRSAPPPS